MALKKAIRINSGYEPEYWSVGHFMYDARTGKVDVIMLAYRSEAAKKEDKDDPVANASFTILPSDPGRPMLMSELDKAGVNPLKRIYEWAKKDPQFAGAEDC